MKIVSNETKHVWKSVTLLNGTVLEDEEIWEYEEKSGKELKVIMSAHILYKSPIEDPRGTTSYREI